MMHAYLHQGLAPGFTQLNTYLYAAQVAQAVLVPFLVDKVWMHAIYFVMHLSCIMGLVQNWLAGWHGCYRPATELMHKSSADGLATESADYKPGIHLGCVTPG